MKDIMKETYIACASGLGLGDFTRVKTGPERAALITKIADMYCKATDEEDDLVRSQTISALMLLFWGEAGKMAEKCAAVQELDYEDYISKLYECIENAMQYRAWKAGEHSAEACIRSSISSRGAAAILYESNLDKNKANVNTYSLDATVDEDSETTRLDLFQSDEDNPAKTVESAAVRLIQDYISKNKIVEAIILDTIAFDDCRKFTKTSKVSVDVETGETYKYSVETSEFSDRALVKVLISLPDNYFQYFMNKYDVDENILRAGLNSIKASSSTNLHKTWEIVKAAMKTKLSACLN